MRRILFSCSVVMFCLVIGCATAPTSEELSKIGYGEPLTIDYKAPINAYFERTLFDPFSAQIRYGEPREYWIKDSPLMGGAITAGYGVPVAVNAKNRFGAYVGWKPYMFIFRNNQLVKIVPPELLSIK